MNDTLTELTELLRKLPGIGPRQARRLSLWLVRQEKGWVDVFAKTLMKARSSVAVCVYCKRLHPEGANASGLCSVCKSEARNTHELLLVEKDVDLENIEKTGAYNGRYFVLGGTTSPLDKEPYKKIRIRELLKLLTDSSCVVDEVIFALSATTEGEDTAAYLDTALKDVVGDKGIKVTKLGRGLSTGTELEYVDKDTMSYALKGRA